MNSEEAILFSGADMGEPVTQAQFFEIFRQLSDKIDAKHRSMGAQLTARFDALDAKLDRHEDEDRAVEKRVHTMEVQREDEEKVILKRSSWLAIIISAAIAICGWIIDYAVRHGG